MKRFLSLSIALVFALPAGASAKRLDVKEITSNSVLTDAEKGIVYGADNMLDEQVATMWVEGEGSAGLGKYIEVQFDGDVELAKIRIWGGCFIDQEFFERHNRLAQIELKFTDFTSQKFDINDEMTPQWLELEEPKSVDKVKIYLRRVHEGNTWNDTAISQIQFFDKGGPTEWIEGMSATASSEYPDENNAYGAHLAVDGWLDTHWVEGAASGDGEFIDVDLGGSKSLSKFAITTGFDTTDGLFQGNNRAGKVTLAFSDGSTQKFDLADSRGLQVFDLKPVTASKVKVTFSGIRKGKTTDDLYIGEVRFAP
ncbi:MAG: hypothetical protein GY898_20835 [Proteobacteria bacterium]|nr:hypothetical protein [Pseudomonadota bacterium]